jgi:hypothetical protein
MPGKISTHAISLEFPPAWLSVEAHQGFFNRISERILIEPLETKPVA